MSKQCGICNGLIAAGSKQYKIQIYCSPKCRKTAHRRKTSLANRLQQKRANLRQNDEMLYVIRQCIRAQTIEILSQHTPESFIATMNLIRNRPKGDVQLCHVSPVKGRYSIGLLHHLNLFYGGRYQNNKFGNKNTGAGLSIRRDSLDPVWHVDVNMSYNDILLRIEMYLGGIIDEYLATSPVRKSKKIQLINKITALAPRLDFERLERLSFTQLLNKYSKLLPQNRFHRFKSKSTAESKYICYVGELTRFIDYGGPRAEVLAKVKTIMIIGYYALNRHSESQTFNGDFQAIYGLPAKKYREVRLSDPSKWSELKDHLYNGAFGALQGEPINVKVLRAEIMGYLSLEIDGSLS
ncbi:hypothetical protein [Pseudomonas syringae]|uniref:hypothetical protein n=1 Tax=Pseudomonas syringae TaxID=317 RepID=UPI003F756090